jgi:uncharacterized SAM-binding protein YcdF (DUF218 family)
MYQFLNALLEPYTFLLFSLLAILIWAWRSSQDRRRSLTLAIVLLICLLLLSMPATGYVALRSLEGAYPPSTAIPSSMNTIVVLGGDSFIDSQDGTTVRIGGETLYRCMHAAQLYQRAGRCRIIVSGGKVDPSSSSLTLAEAMRDFLLIVGVQPDDLVLEQNSSTTFENVRNTSQLLNDEQAGQQIFLVTSASHMTRAARCFERQGIKVIPAPCNHVALRFDSSVAMFIPSVNGIHGVHRAVHEWLGVVWYFCRGRI